MVTKTLDSKKTLKNVYNFEAYETGVIKQVGNIKVGKSNKIIFFFAFKVLYTKSKVKQ